jgi:xanthine dehydrogenase YagT iron-sulfur-binding subunit
LTRAAAISCALHDSIPFTVIHCWLTTGSRLILGAPRRQAVAFATAPKLLSDEFDRDAPDAKASSVRTPDTWTSGTCRVPVCRKPALTFQWSEQTAMSTKNELHDSGDAPATAPPQPSRRRFLQSAAAAATVGAAPHLRAQTQTPAAPPSTEVRAPVPGRPVTLTVNGRAYTLQLEPRVTLLDALREYAGLMGTKKGCDRGQCGACTVIADGRRINSCLTLAVMHEGENITTVEGLAGNGVLSPMQQAFIEHDAFQCGYCTPGQLCSATALLNEFRNGTASTVTADVRNRPPQLSDDEIRERMSGNICRCGAYANIVAAVRAVHEGGGQNSASSGNSGGASRNDGNA